MTEGPVDFTTVKCEEEEQTKEEMDGVQPDMSDMAAFIASATAAVRNAGGNSFQVISTVPPSQPPSTHPDDKSSPIVGFLARQKAGRLCHGGAYYTAAL